MSEVGYFEILGKKIGIKDNIAREKITEVEKNFNADIKKIYDNYDKNKSEIIILGDSISQGWLSTGKYSSNAPQKLLGKKLNKKSHNYGMNASGYTIVNNSFINQANNAINDKTYDHDKVFAIFIIGGINDLNNDNANYDVIKSNRDIVINTLSLHFLGTPIYIIPTYSSNILSIQREYKMSAITSKINTEYSCGVICRDLALWSYTNHNYISNDMIHFTDVGYNVYVNDIISCIFGGSCGSFSNCYKEVALNGAFKGNVYLCRNNNSITLYSYCEILNNLNAENNTLCSLPQPFFPDLGITLWSVPIRINKKNGTCEYVMAEVKPDILSANGNIKIVGNVEKGDTLWINISLPIVSCF